MIRRLLILSCTLGAISIAALGGLGYLSPVHFDLSGSSRSYGYLNLTDGLIRLYAYRSSDDMSVQKSHENRRIVFFRASDGQAFTRIWHSSPDRISNHAIVNGRFGPRSSAPRPTIHMFGVRSTTIAPIAMLMVYPLIAVAPNRAHAPNAGTI